MFDEMTKEKIKKILTNEYITLLDMYYIFERTNKMKSVRECRAAMEEVDMIACKLIGEDVSPYALKSFY